MDRQYILDNSIDVIDIYYQKFEIKTGMVDRQIERFIQIEMDLALR